MDHSPYRKEKKRMNTDLRKQESHYEGGDDNVKKKKHKNGGEETTIKPSSSSFLPWHIIIRMITHDDDPLLTFQKKASLLKTISLVERRASQDVSVFGWSVLADSSERTCRLIRMYAPLIERGDFGVMSDAGMQKIYGMMFATDIGKRSNEARSMLVHKARERHPNKSSLLRIRMMIVMDRATIFKREAAEEYLLTRDDVSKYNVRGTKWRLALPDVKDACLEKFGSHAKFRAALTEAMNKRERRAQAKRCREDRFAEVRRMFVREYERVIDDTAWRILSNQQHMTATEGLQFSGTIAQVFRMGLTSEWHETMLYAQISTSREGGPKTVQDFVNTGRAACKARLADVVASWRGQCNDRLHEVLSGMLSGITSCELPSPTKWNWSQAAMNYVVKASLNSRERLSAIESEWKILRTRTASRKI